MFDWKVRLLNPDWLVQNISAAPKPVVNIVNDIKIQLNGLVQTVYVLHVVLLLDCSKNSYFQWPERNLFLNFSNLCSAALKSVNPILWRWRTAHRRVVWPWAEIPFSRAWINCCKQYLVTDNHFHSVCSVYLSHALKFHHWSSFSMGFIHHEITLFPNCISFLVSPEQREICQFVVPQKPLKL